MTAWNIAFALLVVTSLAGAGCIESAPGNSSPSSTATAGTVETSPTDKSAACAPKASDSVSLRNSTASDDRAGDAAKGLYAPSQVASGAPLNVSVVLGPAPKGQPHRVIALGLYGVHLGNQSGGNPVIEAHVRWHATDVVTEKRTNSRLNITLDFHFAPGDYEVTICLERMSPPQPTQETLSIEHINGTVRVD